MSAEFAAMKPSPAASGDGTKKLCVHDREEAKDAHEYVEAPSEEMKNDSPKVWSHTTPNKTSEMNRKIRSGNVPPNLFRLLVPLTPGGGTPLNESPLSRNTMVSKGSGLCSSHSRSIDALLPLPRLTYPSHLSDPLRDVSVKCPDGTYQFVARSSSRDSGGGCDGAHLAGRRDVRRLEEEYERVMRPLVEACDHHWRDDSEEDLRSQLPNLGGNIKPELRARSAAAAAPPTGRNDVEDQKIQALQERIGEELRDTQSALWDVLSTPYDGGHNLDLAEHPSLEETPLTAFSAGSSISDCMQREMRSQMTDLLHNAGITCSSLTNERDVLARCVYEHRWTDLLSSELGRQMSAQCVEHGRLMQSFRVHCGRVFQALWTALDDKARQLNAVVIGMPLAWTNCRGKGSSSIVKEGGEKYSSEPEGDAMPNSTGRTGAWSRPMAGSHHGGIQAMSLERDALSRRLVERERELGRLRTIVEELLVERSAHNNLEAELKRLQAEVQLLKNGPTTNSNLECDGSDRSEESQLFVEPYQSSSEDDSEEDEPISTKDKLSSSLFLARMTPNGTVLWKEQVEDASAVTEVSKRIYLLPCHSYRAMLTAVSSPPIRSPCWLRKCMRAILWSASDRRDEDRGFVDDVYFPQFVYSWFEPAYVESGTQEDRMRKQRNDDRWGLYFGTKHLSQSDYEASLFYDFLDGNQSEDYVSFFFCVLQELNRVCGKLLADQFVPASSAYESLDSLFQSTRGSGLNFFHEKCPQSVWLPLSEAISTVSTLFSLNGDAFTAGVVEEVKGMALSTEGRLTFATNMDGMCDDAATKSCLCVDLFQLMHFILAEYRKESQWRRAVTRIMFATAETGVLTDYSLGADSIKDIVAQDDRGVVCFPQFFNVARSLCPNVCIREAAMLYRESYDIELSLHCYKKSYPKGISFDSFIVAADRRGFFSRSRECHILHRYSS